MHSSHCPNCGTQWISDQTVTEYFISQGNSPSEAADIAAHYGCTPQSPQHFSINIICQKERDSSNSRWKCTNCNSLFTYDMQLIKD